MLLATLIQKLRSRRIAAVWNSLRRARPIRSAGHNLLVEFELCQLEERRVLNAAPVAAHSGQSGNQNLPGPPSTAVNVLNLDTASHFTAPWISSPAHGDSRSVSPVATGGHAPTGSLGAEGSHAHAGHGIAQPSCTPPVQTQAGRPDCGPLTSAGPAMAGNGLHDFDRPARQCDTPVAPECGRMAAAGIVPGIAGNGVFEFSGGTAAVESASPGLMSPSSAQPAVGGGAASIASADSAVQPLTASALAGPSLTVASAIVNASDPVVTPEANQVINEGTTLALAGVTFTDPNNSAPYTAMINWGDGQTTAGVVDPTTDSVTGTHDYTVVGNFTVTVTVTDSQNLSGSGSFTVQVNNVPPTINPIANQTAGVGTTFALTGVTFSDPGTVENHTASINWGDGTPSTVGPVSEFNTPTGIDGSVTGNHVYATAGIYEGTVTVKDNHGAASSQPFLMIVGNVAPTLTTTLNDVTLNVGDTLSLTNVGFTEAIFAGPAQGYTPNLTYTINWGDSSTPSTGPATITQAGSPGVQTTGDFSGSHEYTTANTYTASVTISDGLGGTATEIFTVMVINPAPVIQPVPTQTVAEGSTLSLSGATFTDPDPSGSYTASIDWGDGTTPTTATIAPTSTPGMFTVKRHARLWRRDHAHGQPDGDRQ